MERKTHERLSQLVLVGCAGGDLDGDIDQSNKDIAAVLAGKVRPQEVAAELERDLFQDHARLLKEKMRRRIGP